MPAAEIYRLADSADPTKDMLKTLPGVVDKVELSGAKVLVWIYISPRKTKGGIILSDKSKQEDIWQGNVGYVLKTGPLAFEDDEKQNIKFAGFKAQVGEWVTFVPGDGARMQIGGFDCRLFEDASIRTKIADPSIITHAQ